MASTSPTEPAIETRSVVIKTEEPKARAGLTQRPTVSKLPSSPSTKSADDGEEGKSARERLGLPRERTGRRERFNADLASSTTDTNLADGSANDGSPQRLSVRSDPEGEHPEVEEQKGFTTALNEVGDDALYARKYHRSFNVYLTVTVLLNVLIIIVCQSICIFGWPNTDEPDALAAADVHGTALKTKYPWYPGHKTSPSAGLDDAGFLRYSTVLLWLTVVITGLGLEIVVGEPMVAPQTEGPTHARPPRPAAGAPAPLRPCSPLRLCHD